MVRNAATRADDALQNSTLERLVAALVFSPASAPTLIVGLRKNGGGLSLLQHHVSLTARSGAATEQRQARVRRHHACNLGLNRQGSVKPFSTMCQETHGQVYFPSFHSEHAAHRVTALRSRRVHN